MKKGYTYSKYYTYSTIKNSNLFFTVCQHGYYGITCSLRCSKNCYVPSRCDRFTGKCVEGCKPGWRTDSCELSKRSFVRILIAFIFFLNFFLTLKEISLSIVSYFFCFPKHNSVNNGSNIA